MSDDSPLSIYECPSFAEFFAAYVQKRKGNERSYSFGVISRILKGCAPSLLAMIARGERTPQPDLLLRLCGHMGLTKKETEYAEALVGYERAKTAQEKTHFLERLRLLKPLNEDLLVELDTFDLIHRWHNVAICEMADLKGFKDDPRWISMRLGGLITADQAAESLNLLFRLGLLRRDESGRIKKVARGYKTPKNAPSLAGREFQRQMFLKAEDALANQAVDERYFTGSTIAISTAKIEQAAQLIGDFREAFKKLIGQPDGNEVYHLAIQFFRVTEGRTSRNRAKKS